MIVEDDEREWLRHTRLSLALAVEGMEGVTVDVLPGRQLATLFADSPQVIVLAMAHADIDAWIAAMREPEG